MKVIVDRDGSAVLYPDFGQRPVKSGDVILLGSNVLCGSESAQILRLGKDRAELLTPWLDELVLERRRKRSRIYLRVRLAEPFAVLVPRACIDRCQVF